MFWGRLAARLAGVPVVTSALHSTGGPDRVERIKRWLTPCTNAFVAVADKHRRYLVREERFPADRVATIRNGVATVRFRPGTASRSLRSDHGIPPRAPLVGTVGALRHEKNHRMFVASARRVLEAFPQARFVIVGDGPERASIERSADRLGIGRHGYLLGTRHDIPEILSCLDVFVLSSYIEASPVAIPEAMACGFSVVATRVGSVEESVRESTTGTLVPLEVDRAMATGIERLLADPNRARAWGAAGRAAVVKNASLTTIVRGYEALIERIDAQKCARSARTCRAIRC